MSVTYLPKHCLTFAARLWNSGEDTKRIAKRLGTTEQRVYNSLDDIKSRARSLR